MNEGFKGYREHSRTNWGCSGNPTLEQINSGHLARIADAVEKVAVRHTELMTNVDHWKARALRAEADLEILTRRLSAMKGALTKAKKKAGAPAQPKENR